MKTIRFVLNEKDGLQIFQLETYYYWEPLELLFSYYLIKYTTQETI